MFNKTDPSFFEGEWTFEKTEHAVLGLCKTLDRYAHKLTLEDLQNDSRCSRIPNLGLERVQEVIRDVETKLWRGVEPLKNEVIYHTGPHHDDIMLGIMPLISRQLREPSPVGFRLRGPRRVGVCWARASRSAPSCLCYKVRM